MQIRYIPAPWHSNWIPVGTVVQIGHNTDADA
jgi:hypothetical protein